MSPISGYLPGNARWLKQGPVERRRNGGAAQGSLKLVRFEPEDSIPRIGCFLIAFVHLLRTLPKEVSRSTATKVESGILDANRGFLVCESLETGKEGQKACQKNSDRVCLKGQLNTRCSGWRNKEQGSWTGILLRGNHRQSEPKEGKVKVRDLRGILVRSSRAQGQEVGRSIYIYTSWPARRCPGIRAPRWWTLLELSRFMFTQSRDELFTNETDCFSLMCWLWPKGHFE